MLSKDKKSILTKEEREQASITIVKTLLSQDVPIEDIEYLSGKSKSEIEKIGEIMKKS